MRNKKKVILCSCVFILLGCILIGFRIYVVNSRTPQTKMIEVQHNNFHKVKKGIEMCIGEVKWIDERQMAELYGDCFEEEQRMDYKGIEVEVIFRNTSKENKSFPLVNLYIESKKYDWNGVDMNMFMKKNDSSMTIRLKPGQTKRIHIPYAFLRTNYPSAMWNQLQEDTYFLVFNRYPEKTCWMLSK